MPSRLRIPATIGGTLLALAAAHPARAQVHSNAYTRMAPVAQYLMEDRQSEIALAQSAAPASIARYAAVMVLTPHGFETAIPGSNGFVCIVGRGWSSAAPADFWNPNVRVPMCLNAAAAHSYLLRITKATTLALAGETPAQVDAAMAAAVATKQLPPMEPGAMCYMMSKQGYGGDVLPHWPPHVMFFYSDMDVAAWGANLPGSPVFGVTDPSEHLTQFVVQVSRWSDGTLDGSVDGTNNDPTPTGASRHHHL